MLQGEATKLFEVERLIRALLERKSLPGSARTELGRALRLIQEAIAYEDDESPCRGTDD